jgi:hypothetical protein
VDIHDLLSYNGRGHTHYKQRKKNGKNGVVSHKFDLLIERYVKKKEESVSIKQG